MRSRITTACAPPCRDAIFVAQLQDFVSFLNLRSDDEKRSKGCMARIVPNYSAFRKRNRTIRQHQESSRWLRADSRLIL
jgi:hypothetical protein